MNPKNWKTQLQAELKSGEAARKAGNEGKARVCARRAAGIAIGEYLQRHNFGDPGRSAYDQLRFISTLPDIPTRVQEIATYLTLRVDEAFKLPINADLIAESRELAETLLGQALADE